MSATDAKERGLSIIVPAFNEEAGITSTLGDLQRAVKSTGMTTEVIVVDDGSSDNTSMAASEAPGVSVIEHVTNRGYGAALKSGIRYARYDLICITDADGTYPVDSIPELVDGMRDGDADMTVGARIRKGAAIPLIRRPGKWILGKLANFVAGEKIPDLNSGLRVFRKHTASRFMNLLPDGFSFTSTLTLGMIANGYEVKYLPIGYAKRTGRSKIRPIPDFLNFIRLVVRVALYFSPLKVFLPIGLALIALSACWGVVSKLVFGRLADISTVLIAASGVQVCVMGLLAELINIRAPNLYISTDGSRDEGERLER